MRESTAARADPAARTAVSSTAPASTPGIERRARIKDAGSDTDAPAAATNQTAGSTADPSLLLPVQPAPLPDAVKAPAVPPSVVAETASRSEPAPHAVGGVHRTSGPILAPSLSRAAADGVDQPAAGMATASVPAHLAEADPSRGRKSTPAPAPASVDVVVAARAAPATSGSAGSVPVSHPSPPVAAVAATDDAAAGSPASSIAAGAEALQPVLGTAAPSSSPVREAAAAREGDPASVATAQVAPAMISLASRTDGSNEIRISLHPRDLGQVEIRLIRGSDGSTSVTVVADRPETLQELAQNAHHLHAALDAASLPAEGRTLDFASASAFTPDRGQNDASGQRSAADQAPGHGGSGERGSGQDRAWSQDRQRAAGSDVNADSSIYGAAAPISSRRQWRFNGLNITA